MNIRGWGEANSVRKRLAAKLGLMDTAIANKFIKTLSVAEAPSRGVCRRQGKT